MASANPLELRVDPRSGANLPLELFSTSWRGGLAARSRDVSVGGACVVTRSPFTLDSLEGVVLGLPDAPLRLEAEGRWQQALPHDDVVMSGIAFRGATDAAVERLWDLVLDASKGLARFIYSRSELHGIGLEGAMGLAQLTRYRELSPGQRVYSQGKAAPGESSIFLIDKGTISIQVTVRNALEKFVDRLGPGMLFGGLPLLSGVDHPETAVAATETRLLEIDEGAFRYLSRAKPWLAQSVAQAVTGAYARRLHAVLAQASDRL